MSTENPLVSVCLPVYNGGPCAASAAIGLEQTFQDFGNFSSWTMLLRIAPHRSAVKLSRKQSGALLLPLGHEPRDRLEPESGG